MKLTVNDIKILWENGQAELVAGKAVSYTHLDVYKRQPLVWNVLILFPGRRQQ